MSIYKQIDSIFSSDSAEKPAWADEILNELQEIKKLLKEQKESTNKVDTDYYNFVKEFRNIMKADITNNIYPTFHYQGKKLGVDFKGLLYDKQTQKYLSKTEAFQVYRYAYINGSKVFS